MWAGDYSSAKEYFAKPSSTNQIVRPDGRSGVDYLTMAKERRSTQLRNAEAKYKKAVANLPQNLNDVTLGGLRLGGTSHLEGVVFRVNARRFTMRGYLKDLQWAGEFMRKAEAMVKTASKSETSQPPKRNLPRPRNSNSTDPTPKKSCGFSWELSGELFIEVHVSRLGLISAFGFWTKTEMPDAEIIKKKFQEVLQQLDPETK